MNAALVKALRRADAVATAAFDRGARDRIGDPSGSIIPALPLAGVADWQRQQAHAERYGLLREWVYAAVNALASEAAGQPVVVARLTGSSSKGRPKGSKLYELARMPKRVRRKAAEVEYEIQHDHQLVDLLEHPNIFQERWQFVYSFIANLVLTGMAYVVLGHSEQRDRMEAYSLPSTWVRPDHEKGLFSRFVLRNPQAIGAEEIVLDRNQVGFALLPNPGNPLTALAPASSQLRTLRIHEHMLNGQEAFFRNGIFPSVIVTMAQGPYQNIKGRPVLTNAQRREIYHALRQNVMGDLNQGTAFIVDGLIEDMKPFSLTNREIGWDKTEDKIKTRILSAFGVHSFILGEFMPGSQAQAEIIEARFYKRVNTYLEMLGQLLTNLLGSVFPDERMLIWFEECQASNPERRTSTFLAMRAAGDISQNELRAEMGLPPDEDLNQAVIQPSMMPGVSQILNLLGQGLIGRDQAVATLEGMGIPTELAEKIAGEEEPQAVALSEQAPSAVPSSPPAAEAEVEEEKPGGQPEEEESEAMKELKRADLLLAEALESPRRAEERKALEELRHANLLLARVMENPEWQAEELLRSVECR